MMQIENDGDKLVKLLASTLNADLRKQAEDELSKIHNVNGFAPTLLQLIMSAQIEMPVRQAGVIYLKNMISQCWAERLPTDPTPKFILSESDKQIIRDNVIEAVIHSPETIRVQLIVCVRTITTNDFPTKWTAIVDKVHQYIQTNDVNSWYGALQAFYQLCKIYEYKSIKERDAYHNAMRVLLPMFLERIYRLNDDSSDLSVLTQKQILKIFFTFIQFILPLDVLDKQNLSTWIEICNLVLQRAIPDHVEQVDVDERQDLSYWKIKKWALRILNRIFERYGTPNSTGKEYFEFANFFLKGYAVTILSTILQILEQYRNGIYISPRVLQQSIIFIEQAVSPSYTWKFMKQHMLVIIQEILYPLMCHTDEDDDLFENDPVEYIKIKYDVFEDFISPVNAARQLIYQVASKRKDMLQKTMVFAMQVLSNQNLPPRQKDGILHIVGSVAKILLKKNVYKDQVELMLYTYVFPEFQSQHGFLRARACWVLKSFAKVKFKSHDNLITACNYIKHCILNDTCLPVSVEACIALQDMLSEDEIEINTSVKDNVAPHIQPILLKMLNLVRETENDDISNVIQRLIYVYEDEISSFAVEIMKHLCETFLNIIKSCQQEDEDSDAKDDKTITAVGLLTTIDSVLNVMEEKAEILTNLESVILPVIYAIMQNGMMDYYEELFSLISTLTARQITPQMWQVLFSLHELFQQDAADYFTELMPVLHNYVTVDPKAFMNDQKYFECLFKMIKQVLNANMEDDEAETHALKLLEIIILQYHHTIENVLPSILEVVFQRLSRDITNSELRTMCIQVVIAALWCNTDFVLRTLDTVQSNGESILSKFLQQWFNDIDCFLGLHDRKVCALGLCTLLELAPTRADVAGISQKILPSCCTIYENLERVYQARSRKDSDSEFDDYDGDIKELESDEDDEDDEGKAILNQIKNVTKKMNGVESSNGDGAQNADGKNESEELENEDSDSDDISDDEDDEYDKTLLENYTTCIDENEEVDEFLKFKELLQNYQANQPQFYESITSTLTPDQCKSIQSIITVANRRAAEKESRKILASGGYNFTNFSVPTTFNFGSSANNFF